MDPATVVTVLLHSPHFEPCASARAELAHGSVDPRLVLALAALAERHVIEVSAAHAERSGPVLAADIRTVDRVPVAENPGHPNVLSVGHILRRLPRRRRPDLICGPAPWHRSLGYPASTGFVSDARSTAAHPDRLHLGFREPGRTRNAE